MDIIPNIGVGAVRFGMKPGEVIALFPEAQKYEDWMGGNRNDSLLYQGIIFEFNACNSSGPLANSRLIGIEIFGRKNAVLWGRPIDTWTKEALVSYLDEHNMAYRFHTSGDLHKG